MREVIQKIVHDLFPDVDVVVQTEIPESQFGDLSTNVAMQLAGKLQKNPRETAGVIADELQKVEGVAKVGIAGPGFINVTYTDEQLINNMYTTPRELLKGKKYLVEYSCPNYFKELHAGHLYQTIEGDVIARLVEQAGAEVYRANFGGDVGLHVAKCVWGMVLKTADNPRDVSEERLQQLFQFMQKLDKSEHTSFISSSYVAGSAAYEESDETKVVIDALNKEIYQAVQSDENTTLKQVHDLGRLWSKDYFVRLYEQLEVTAFDMYYPESATEGRGVEIVSTHDEIFTQSDGATVFEGEEYDLHTRVFITSKGLPTYETKDLGLIFTEQDDFPFDQRVLITGRDQQEYMRVVWKVADLVSAGIESKMTHLVNGLIKFGDGQKMSSRLGNVTTAGEVLEAVRLAVGDSGDEQRDKAIYLGAVKYQFLKHRLGGDMAFDPQESVATEGSSGPYLQYAHARAKSIIRKAQSAPENEIVVYNTKLEATDRALVRKLAEYAGVVEEATAELAPHVICTYLYELAQVFNRFYENNKVIGSEEEKARVTLVGIYADTLQKGLNLLGIHAPEQM